MNDILNVLAKGMSALASMAAQGQQQTPPAAEPAKENTADVRKALILERLTAQIEAVVAGGGAGGWTSLGAANNAAAAALALYEALEKAGCNPATAQLAVSKVVGTHEVSADAFKPAKNGNGFNAVVDGQSVWSPTAVNGVATVREIKGDYSLWAPNTDTGKYSAGKIYFQVVPGGKSIKANFAALTAE